MRKMQSIILLFLLNFGILGAAVAGLELVKTIGDEREDYTFFILNGAVLSKNKDIFVLDGKGFFLAKYNWEGKFLTRSSGKGRGPGDLLYPRSLSIHEDKLYLLDRGNFRIAEIDLNLEKCEYYEQSPEYRFENLLPGVEPGTFMGSLSDYKKDRGRIGITNKDGMVLTDFFERFPYPIDFDKFGKQNPVDKYTRTKMINIETLPAFTVDHEKKQIWVSFIKPDNPIVFYLYDREYKENRSFYYKIKEKKYKISDFYLTASWDDIDNPHKYPARSHAPYIDAMFSYKGHLVVFLELRDFQKEKLVGSTMLCLIFNEIGELKAEFPIEKTLRVFSLSKEGYLLAGTLEDEVGKLFIYRLKI